MGALLGCEHCGSVIPRADADGQRNCAACGRPMRVVGLVQARELVRERRIAERFRLEARFGGRKGIDYRPGVV